MSRSNVLIVGLLVVLGVIAYFTVLKPTGEREASYKTGDLKISFDSASIMKIVIAKSGKDFTLQNDGGKWAITSPGKYRVNNNSVTELLGGLGKFKVGSLVSDNTEKQSIYHVDTTGAKVTVTDRGGKSTTVIIGKNGPAFTDFYFRADGSNDVYLGMGPPSFILNQEVKEWRDRQIFKSTNDSVKEIQASVDGKPYDLTRAGSSWKLNGDSIETNEVNSLLSTLTNLNAEDFVDTVPNLQLKPFSVKLLGSPSVDLNFYPVPPDSSKFIVQASTDPQVYTLAKWQAEQIEKTFLPPAKAGKKKK
jgi:hypothetical protein